MIISDTLYTRELLECPICDKLHLVEKRKRVSERIASGRKTEFAELYYRCNDERCDFIPGWLMDENLENFSRGRVNED